MEKTMTLSAESKTMTAGQIDKAVANYRALLEKHGREFNSEVVQSVLSRPELADEMFTLFRRQVEAVSNLIVKRCVKVNRNQTPQEAIDATGRRQYINRDVVNAMPRGEGEEVEIIFFNLGRFVNDEDLEKEYELRGLNPADPYSLAAVNGVDSTFADAYPNGTHWRDSNGKWCYAAFNRWRDERDVRVDRDDYGWDVSWWFAGARK